MPDEQELRAQLAGMGAMLEKRKRRHITLDRYYENECPLPRAVEACRVTKAYKMLMGMATSNWASLIVDSVTDRLEPSGIRSGDDRTDEALWNLWQDNHMDAESKLAHNATFVDGRSFALVWPDPDTQDVAISLDSQDQMIVKYREGSRRHRVAALRHWVDEDATPFATLYRPDGIYKYQGPKNSTGIEGTQWERREAPGERWPLENPLKVVPVVELGVNRRLKPGCYGDARGEFERHTGHIDRINLLTFLGLVVAFWMGFPLRAVVGDKILRDDDGEPLAPFKVGADDIIHFEDPEAKVFQLDAADLKNLSPIEHVEQLATITKTPRHYFPLSGGISNLNADAIRASEAALNSKVNASHKPSLSEGWEEVLRLGGKQLESEVELSERAELEWKDHEFRSLAERADAASKLKDVLPPLAVAEYALNATQGQIARWESQMAGSAFGQLIAAANQPAPPVPEPEPAE